ncbi:MAG: hypothetical protein EBU31_14665 [Proteobacteria bacterium]|nr:hypothetical protein [Pseudomonadota bacterium]
MHDAETGRLQEAIASVRMRQRMKPKDPEVTELLGPMSGQLGTVPSTIREPVSRVEMVGSVRRNASVMFLLLLQCVP